MKKLRTLFSWVLLFVGLLSTTTMAAEVEPDPEGYGRKFTKFFTEIANYDLSHFFLHGKDRFIGFIGNDIQRFYIIFTDVKKSPDNPYLYRVSGKTRVKNNNCDFTGSITVVRSGQAVEQELPDHVTGFILAQVDLAEDKEQPGTGTLTGEMLTEFFIPPQGRITAGDIPGNQSLQFSCTWTSYKTGARKICNFGQGRIPQTGLPDGAWEGWGDGEFIPNPKYHDKGWKTYFECLTMHRDESDPYCREEMRQWWMPEEATSTFIPPINPALAENFGHFAAKVPAKWQAFPTDSGVLFEPRNNTCMVFVGTANVDAANPVVFAQNSAKKAGGRESLRMLPPEGHSFIYAKNDGSRYWLTVQDGKAFWVLVEPRSKTIPAEALALLQSITPGPDYPDFASVATTLNKIPSVIQWLAGRGAAPEGIPVEAVMPAGLPDFANLGNREGDTIPAPAMPNVPDGWTSTTAGHWAVATSADGRLVIASRTYNVAAADMTQEEWILKATAKELTTLLGGANLTMGEGNYYFDLPPGEVMICQRKGRSVDIIFYNEPNALYTWNGVQ